MRRGWQSILFNTWKCQRPEPQGGNRGRRIVAGGRPKAMPAPQCFFFKTRVCGLVTIRVMRLLP